MTFLYTVRGVFDHNTEGEETSWIKYLEWSKLIHLVELVSVDGMLNELLVNPNRENPNDWNFIHVIDNYETGFFTTEEYALKQSIRKSKYNLLAVVIEPDQDCKYINIVDYDFMGYDLLDQQFDISTLSNCGGFDETFSPKDLNKFGLIDDFIKASDIKKRLLINNPGEDHADTNVIAIWRHKSLGR